MPVAASTELFLKVAEVLKAMADPVRLTLLHQLQSGELCVGKLVEGMSCTQANVSKHLGVLKQAGLVTSRRDGNNILYSIGDSAVFDICSVVGGTIERRLASEQAILAATMQQFSPTEELVLRDKKIPKTARSKGTGKVN
jgi:DNA-binding transcriptional ArsR family regulator